MVLEISAFVMEILKYNYKVLRLEKKKLVFDLCQEIFIFFLSEFNVYTTILEKAMATHSSTLAWKIPWTESYALSVYTLKKI